MAVEIPLKNHMVIVDEQDKYLFNEYYWGISKHGKSLYVRGHKKDNRKKKFYLHRIILNPPRGMDVDHIDGNGLNNSRNNIRTCSRTFNNMNRKNVRGCYFEKRRQKWEAMIQFQKKKYHLGYYNTSQEAAAAYWMKKKELCENFHFMK